MLKITRNNNLNGTIEIEGNVVVHLSASVTIDVDNPNGYNSSGITRNIVDTELYKTNLSTIRQEIKRFEDEVYTLEDEMLLKSTEV